MKRLSKNISLYWKFQLIGWTISILMIYLYQSLIYTEAPPAFFATDITAFIIGLVFTHLFKMIIQTLRVFRKRFRFQVFYLAGLTILISMLATYIWMIILINIGELKIRALYGRTIDFFNFFVGNLFLALGIFFGWLVIYFLFHYVKSEEERLKTQLQMVELEAKALRAQMNPHFIFNCMNSIKALIQSDEKQRSIEYLTTFSKLIRTLFQNADKRQISLYDEIETCRFYTQLETMRLNGKLNCYFDIDPNLDLKSLLVPALIIQPFIENAIWHGIVPKGEGIIKVTVKGTAGSIICEVDDDGIGRVLSMKNKPVTPPLHESKGVHLAKARLDLGKKLNDINASITIVDKYENEKATGTKVILEFMLK